MKRDSLVYGLKKWSRPPYALIEVKGRDACSYLQGQTSQNIAKLSIGEGAFAARLNTQGRIETYFYCHLMRENTYLLLVPNSALEITKKLLESNIIMEDAEVRQILTQHLSFFFGAGLYEKKTELEPLESKNAFDLWFFNMPAKVLWEEASKESSTASSWQERPFEELSSDEVNILYEISGQPNWDEVRETGILINDSFLNELAAHYDKGCYLGAEVASKIHFRRGPAYFPVLIELLEDDKALSSSKSELFLEAGKVGKITASFSFEGKRYLRVNLHRDWRLEGTELEFQGDSAYLGRGKILFLPFFKWKNREEMAKELYFEGNAYYTKGGESSLQKAILTLKKALGLDPKLEEAHEALGVILANQATPLEGMETAEAKEKRDSYLNQAVASMKKVLEINPDSVMAHSNLSLYFMKQGQIEVAEKHKALSLENSFKQHAKKSAQKKDQKKALAAKKKDQERKEAMFKQVLDLDEEDVIANFGLAQIFFERGEFAEGLSFCLKALKSDTKYSQAYLLKGKCLEALGKRDEAKSSYEEGIAISLKKGEMMPANEMQRRMTLLKAEKSI